MKVSKEIKKNGKVAFDGPKVKNRKKFAPATKKEKPKKGSGSYTRNEKWDDGEHETAHLKEETHIINFIEALMSKNYSEAHKYLSVAVETKLQQRIAAELSTPLF